MRDGNCALSADHVWYELHFWKAGTAIKQFKPLFGIIEEDEWRGVVKKISRTTDFIWPTGASLLSAHGGFSCFFRSHVNHLVVCFDSLEPVAHLMHSALMVMFRMLAINSDHIGFGQGREAHSHV